MLLVLASEMFNVSRSNGTSGDYTCYVTIYNYNDIFP